MMMTEIVIETLVQYRHLRRLITREDLIGFSRRESSRTYIILKAVRNLSTLTWLGYKIWMRKVENFVRQRLKMNWNDFKIVWINQDYILLIIVWLHHFQSFVILRASLFLCWARDKEDQRGSNFTVRMCLVKLTKSPISVLQGSYNLPMTCWWQELLLLLLLLRRSTNFLSPGTSPLEPIVQPTTQASSFRF